MGVENLLDLAREELLAAAVDHLLEAADDAQAAMGTDHAEIATAEPAVGQEGFGVGGGVMVVAEMDRGAIAADVARLARRDVVPIGVDEAQPHVARWHADRAGDALGIIRRARIGLVSGFEHAEQLEQYARCGAPPGPDGLDRRRSATADHDAQTLEVAPRAAGLLAEPV